MVADPVASAFPPASERNMVDLHTKIILTIIALALAGLLAVQLVPQPAKAQGGGCGDSVYNPCYVKVIE